MHYAQRKKAMTDKKDDETYSLIFSSLRHPARRKILRMLENHELTFSEILEALAIDSGHLSYHLENLGDLITRASDGKYKLSSFGVAAIRLMKGVEEYTPPAVSKSRSNVAGFTKIFSVVLVVTLLMVSLYSMNFMTTTEAEVASWPPNLQLALDLNQTFCYAVNFTYDERFQAATASSYGISIVTSRFANAVNEWEEYYLFLDFDFNQTYQLDITVRESSAKVISSALWSGTLGLFSGGSGTVITHPDNYTVGVQNIGTGWVYGSMGIRVLEQRFQRPLFYYGLAGIITASLYPAAIMVIWRWRKRDPINKNVQASNCLRRALKPIKGIFFVVGWGKVLSQTQKRIRRLTYCNALCYNVMRTKKWKTAIPRNSELIQNSSAMM
jgi:hypothetical protein